MKNIFNYFYCINNKQLERNVFDLSFKNPVGLAAGFDKNAKVFNEFASFGFGFIEIGTVTPISQKGNSKPRLFRLKKDKAIINRMGFNNDGIDVIIRRLKKKHADIIIGGNIGKNKLTPNEVATDDYVNCFKKISAYVDYLVLNISSPNTPDLVDLQNKLHLNKLLSRIQKLNKDTCNKPVLIKISPDLNFSQIDEILKLIEKFKISGIIATNTSSKRDNLQTSRSIINSLGKGGLSGKPLYFRSKEIVSYIHKKTKARIPIIAVGGIMNADDAINMFNAGTNLVQIYSGFIYEGPSLVKQINTKLLIS